jgi:hypothetical protein
MKNKLNKALMILAAIALVGTPAIVHAKSAACVAICFGARTVRNVQCEAAWTARQAGCFTQTVANPAYDAEACYATSNQKLTDCIDASTSAYNDCTR